MKNYCNFYKPNYDVDSINYYNFMSNDNLTKILKAI